MIRPTHLPGVAWKLYPGSYSDYLVAVVKEKAQWLAQREQERKEKAVAEGRAAEEARKLAAREKEKVRGAEAGRKKVAQKFAKMSVAELEKAIGKLEDQLANLEASFGNPKVAAHPQVDAGTETEI